MATYESKKYATIPIAATQVADGSVTNAEYQFINTVSSNVQTQIDSKLDSAGRIQIPENLRKYSEIGINDDVTVTGSGPVIEIWSTKVWKKIQNDADKAFANINEVKG